MSTIYTEPHTIEALFLAIDDLQGKGRTRSAIDHLRTLGDLAGGLEGLIHQVIADTPAHERDWQAIASALHLPSAQSARQAYEPPTAIPDPYY